MVIPCEKTTLIYGGGGLIYVVQYNDAEDLKWIFLMRVTGEKQL